RGLPVERGAVLLHHLELHRHLSERRARSLLHHHVVRDDDEEEEKARPAREVEPPFGGAAGDHGEEVSHDAQQDGVDDDSHCPATYADGFHVVPSYAGWVRKWYARGTSRVAAR